MNSVSWHPQNPTVFVSASDDCRIKLWGLPEYPLAEVDQTKPKRIDYDPATNTSFGALGSGGVHRRGDESQQESSSDDFEQSSDAEVDEENEDEEGWGG